MGGQGSIEADFRGAADTEVFLKGYFTGKNELDFLEHCNQNAEDKQSVEKIFKEYAVNSEIDKEDLSKFWSKDEEDIDRIIWLQNNVQEDGLNLFVQ